MIIYFHIDYRRDSSITQDGYKTIQSQKLLSKCKSSLAGHISTVRSCKSVYVYVCMCMNVCVYNGDMINCNLRSLSVIVIATW